MYDDSVHIKRLNSEKDIEFDNLRKEGIKLIQQLSGNIWTDYNLHDPGVTILEQLIYALTELVYLTNSDVKDVLTQENGEIDYTNLGLFQPLEIFPSENITSIDYCKSIFDKIEGIRNIWATHKSTDEIQGCYNFLIDLRNGWTDKGEVLKERVIEFYCAGRNLCEDINDVEFLTRKPIEVGGTIDIEVNSVPEEVMANILFSCLKVISPRMIFHSYQSLKDLNLSLDDILCGPQMLHGYIKDDEMPEIRSKIFISELMRDVFQVTGVKSISDFFIEKDGKKVRSEIIFPNPLVSAFIKLPDSEKDLKINLLQNNKLCKINVAEMLRLFNSLNHKYRSIYNTEQDIAALSELPKGQYLKFDNYHSIQNDFPTIYGINENGVPYSFPAERKAKVKQLKAYIYLFEQILANCFAQMENVKELFTVKQKNKATYFAKMLDNIPGINDVIDDEWKEDKELHKTQLNEILFKYDDYYERKNRILDFILAMYGEKLLFKNFSQFNYYYSDKELPKIILESKTLYLEQLVSVSRFKSLSFNYQKPSWGTDNVPMIKKKISLLLGINDFRQMAYSDVLANYNLQFYKETAGLQCADCFNNFADFNKELDEYHINQNFTNVKSQVITDDSYNPRDVIKEIACFKNGKINEEFFRNGVNLKSFKIGKLKNRNEYTVVFKHPKNETYLYLSDFEDRDYGMLTICRLHHLLIQLNRQSEGMHIVEHVLFRQTHKGSTIGCVVSNDLEEPIFKSSGGIVLGDKEEIEQVVADILITPYNYHIEINFDGNYLVTLHQNGVRVLTGCQYYDDIEYAEDAKQRYIEYFNILNELNIIQDRIAAVKGVEIPDDFYPYRISIVFPAWSARFNNKQFRHYVRDVFHNNLPAHVYPEFYWLDLKTLNGFERMYKDWLDDKSNNRIAGYNEYSNRIVRFLFDQQNLNSRSND